MYVDVYGVVLFQCWTRQLGRGAAGWGGVVVLAGGWGGTHWRSCATAHGGVGAATECKRYCIDGGVMRCGLRQRHALTKLGLP